MEYKGKKELERLVLMANETAFNSSYDIKTAKRNTKAVEILFKELKRLLKKLK